MSQTTLRTRSQSRARGVADTTTQHNFYYDGGLDDADSANSADSADSGKNATQKTSYCHEDAEDAPVAMRRQDSGYESISPKEPSSLKNSPRRRPSGLTVRSSSSNHSGRTRSSARRSVKCSGTTRQSKAKSSKNGRSTHVTPVSTATSYYGYETNGLYHDQDPALMTYFQFPSPEMLPSTDIVPYRGAEADNEHDCEHDHEQLDEVAYPCPPQTTHYWTSDRTRRLEYAAIDAASRGFKGWIMRHVVPACFVPKDMRRIGFDDDTGSVRRYRIALESEEQPSSKTRQSGPEEDPGSDVGPKKGRAAGGWWPGKP